MVIVFAFGFPNILSFICRLARLLFFVIVISGAVLLVIVSCCP
jgi:hypothetical protein